MITAMGTDRLACRLAVVLAVVTLTSCGDNTDDTDAGRTETTAESAETTPAEPGATPAADRVAFDNLGDLCAYVSVEELITIVQTEVRPPVADEDAVDGTRYRSCAWDIGPEFAPGDNSDVVVNVNDRDFWNDPLRDPQSVVNFNGHDAEFSAAYEVSVDMGGWSLGVSVYAGHNAGGEADPAFSGQALEQFAALFIERVEAGAS